MTNWFSSDFHLGHNTILKGHRSEIFSSVDDMTEKIWDNLFSKVRKGDNFYFLGDLFWKVDEVFKKKFFDQFSKMGVNFIWIEGNHDKNFHHAAIKWKGQLKEIRLEQQSIILSHYPMLVWNKSHYNAWLLYGHIHQGDMTHQKINQLGTSVEYFMGKSLNVNLEFWNYKPISFEEISIAMKEKPDNWDLIKKV